MNQSYIYDGINYLDYYKKLNLVHELDKNDLFEDSLENGYKILDKLNVTHNHQYQNKNSILTMNNSNLYSIDIKEYDE